MYWILVVGAALLIDRGKTAKIAAGLFLLTGLLFGNTWFGESARMFMEAID